MSMSIYIHGVRDKEKIEKAEIIRQYSKELGISYNSEIDDIVEDYVDLPIKNYQSNGNEVIHEINIDEIPKDVKVIQIVESY